MNFASKGWLLYGGEAEERYRSSSRVSAFRYALVWIKNVIACSTTFIYYYYFYYYNYFYYYYYYYYSNFYYIYFYYYYFLN